eukprot:3545106-Amphidinium_carterae.1
MGLERQTTPKTTKPPQVVAKTQLKLTLLNTWRYDYNDKVAKETKRQHIEHASVHNSLHVVSMRWVYGAE